MNTGVYLRKSRAEEQTDTAEETLKRHKETLCSYAKTNNLQIIDIYEEVVSGENLYTRTEMLRLLNDVEGGRLEAVLCMDIDRLGRGSMSQQGIILETLKTARVKIITPRKTYDLNNDQDEEYTEFQAFFARHELKTIKRRMQQGITKSVQDGGYLANAPYGYEKCRIGKIPSLKIIDDEAEFVRMIFDLYANKGYGCLTIAQTLNSLGAVPKRGAEFSRTTVRAIIQNKVYIGKIVWNKRRHRRPNEKNQKNWSDENPQSEWIISNGLHQPIVDEQLFNRANEIFTGRYHAPYFAGKLTNPLAGIITCGHCGGKMVRRVFKKGSKAYLICTTGGCAKMTAYDRVEAALLSVIKEQLAELKAEKAIPQINNDNIIKSGITAVKKEIVLADIQKNKLYNLLEQGVYTPTIFAERKAIIEEKLQKLNNTYEQLNKNQGEKKNTHNDIENVFDIFEMANVDEKNLLLKMLIKNASYYKKKKWATDRFILTITLNEM